METEKIILASGSPRRSQLLQWAEVEFEIIVSNTDESYPEHLSACEVAMHIATRKATDVQNNFNSNISARNTYPILGADTIVVLNNKIVGKPSGREEAISTLAMLSGMKHTVITGICILFRETKIVFAEQTEVEFLPLSTQQITYYVDNYMPYDKAGAYAIQEWIGVIGIKSIKGDFYNVMGLPVSRVVKELRGLEAFKKVWPYKAGLQK